MTTSDLAILQEINKRLIRLEEILIDKVPSKSDWITEKQAASEFEYSLSTIRKYRKDGTFTRVKEGPNGRKIRLSRKELQGKLQMRRVA